MNFNKVILAGNLTSEPEMRKTPSGQPVCNFSIATNRYWTDKDSGEKKQKAEYHDIVAWRRLAEIASQYLSKGSLVLIEGRLQTRSWEDSNDNTRSKTEVVAKKMQMGPRVSKGEAPDMQQQQLPLKRIKMKIFRSLKRINRNRNNLLIIQNKTPKMKTEK